MKVEDDTKIVAMAKVIREDEDDSSVPKKEKKEKPEEGDEQLSLT